MSAADNVVKNEDMKKTELEQTIGYLIDASEPQGNGESIVQTETIEDLRELMFGKRGMIDE